MVVAVVVVFGAVEVRVDVPNSQRKATVRELIVGRAPGSQTASVSPSPCSALAADKKKGEIELYPFFLGKKCLIELENNQEKL